MVGRCEGYLIAVKTPLDIPGDDLFLDMIKPKDALGFKECIKPVVIVRDGLCGLAVG